MGNFISSNFLAQPVSASLLFLTNCKSYIGTYNDILRFFKNYSMTKQSGSFYVLLSYLKQISKKTPLFGFEESLFRSFRSSGMKLNLMEVFAAVITFSTSPWKVKAKLAFIVFDFDTSKTLNKAETTIMVISFVRGIAAMTDSCIYDSLDLEPLGKHCFDLANSSSDGLISLNDFVLWVSKTQEILTLFTKCEPSKTRNRRTSITKARNSTFTKRVSVRAGSRRASKTVNSSLPLVKERIGWKNKERDVKKLHELFFKHVHEDGRSPVGKIYQELMENRRFQKESEFLFHEFNFDMNKLIEFSQLIEYFEKVKSKNGFFMKVGKEVIYPTNDPVEGKGRRKSMDAEVLKHMFEKFDKNKDGFLNLEELKEGLRDNFTKESILEVFEHYDRDGNKLIDFGEFLKVFSPHEKFSKKK